MSDDPRSSEPRDGEPAAPTPRPILFRTLTILWIFPSVGAVWILLHDTHWLAANGLIAAVLAVRAEQWLAVGLLFLHGWFAWRWRQTQSAGGNGA